MTTSDSKTLDFGAPKLALPNPAIMGVLNVTPDSFSDGGRHDAPALAVAHARIMVEEGADILDIGGESTRPGATPVPAEEEWQRIAPVIKQIVAMGVPVSIDTYKAETARRAVHAGTRIVNDVWGLQKDPAMADTAADLGVPVIMMHNREAADAEIDILADIDRFFERSMELAERAGIPRSFQMLDPGIGFGKTIDQNFLILNRLETLSKHGLPLLVGASRKKMIGAVLDVPTDDRLYGSLAAHTIAMHKGAAIIRAHDVKPHKDAARLIAAIHRESATDR
ncbi:dihydropteroate synthase [Hongsoonwoonella zoysiae]|uniref:dihydropteroate synthase n=1 Tax=Hongsoonwoonella zoysiae TaxID=2821844 RepID=UPI001FE5E3F2|nr:dihydropteroate synthase [Hongsoonwoonella zoysiae]